MTLPLSESSPMPSRRAFLASTAALPIAATLNRSRAAETASTPSRGNPIAVSTYSFWRYNDDSKVPVTDCIDNAAKLGFDAVELLHVQMEQDDPATLRSLKRRAFFNGLPICGLSTHQTFVSPDEAVRKKNIEQTIHCIEVADALGAGTIRVNTGRWGTIPDFDELMKNRGIEPRLAGYTDDEGFQWVIDSITKCLPAAEKHGVVLGLENHWGLGRTADGVLRIVNAIDSPWLKATLDTGNFLDDTYEQIEKLAPKAAYMQAKTYYGGGKWYTLDLDYPRIGKIMKDAGYKGYVSLEFEGQEDWETGIPKSLELLRKTFA